MAGKFEVGKLYRFTGLKDWSLTSAFEDVEKEFRPFASAEEFKPFRDKWIVYGGTTMKVGCYKSTGIAIGTSSVMYDWKKSFESITFDDGTPFGMKI